MTSIFMNVDRMRHVAREMRLIAEEHERRAATMRALLSRLREVWIGPSPEQYITKQEGALVRLDRMAREIATLANELEHEAYKYESMDKFDGFGGGGGGAW